MTIDAAWLIAPDLDEVGGVQRATRQLESALRHIGAETRVFQLGPRSGNRSPRTDSNRVLFTLRTVGSLAPVSRGAVVVIAAHPNLAPVAYLAARRARCPYVVWAHGYEVWGPLRRTVSWSLAHADVVWAGSAITAEQLTAKHGMNPDRVRLQRYCFTPEITVPDGVAKGAATVLAVSRLTRQNAYKGVDTLVLAWPHVLREQPNARLVVVGDGDDRVRLERLANHLRVDEAITFLGAVDDVALGQLYARSNVFALPGRAGFGKQAFGEGFGLVFLEAAAACLPTVAGNAGGAPEAVVDGVTGLVVDPHSHDAVAAAIVRLLTDRELAQQMGMAGSVRVANEFSFDVFCSNVRKRLDELTS